MVYICTKFVKISQRTSELLSEYEKIIKGHNSVKI